MTQKMHLTWILFFFFGCPCLWAESNQTGLGNMFPDLPGWQKKGKPEVYNPDNLFEYIDGAAEVFLSYNFQELATLTYDNPQKQSITIDIYLHDNARNGFGIYAQEKPIKGDFISLGTQGYYEKGTCNFFQGSYYIKMSSFNMGQNERELLIQIGQKIGQKLTGQAGFPLVLKCFPEERKIPNSERFIARDYLGHAFIHSAFTVDYNQSSLVYQIFIIEGKTETEVKDIVDSYLGFIGKKGNQVENKNGILRFEDPYYQRNGKMNLKVNALYAWGLFTTDERMAEFLLQEIEKKLLAAGLIKKAS